MIRVLLWIAAAMPILLGFVIGMAVRIAVFAWAALLEGYMMGRGI